MSPALKSGYGWKTVRANMVILSADGLPPQAQFRIAFDLARKSFFHSFPHGLLPAWLAYPKGARARSHYDEHGAPLETVREKNPVPPSSVARAMQAYRAFSGHEPESIGRVTIPGARARAAWVLGELDFIGYTTIRDGVQISYQHDFAKKARPLLAVTSDGQNLLIVNGRFSVTDAGIEDA